MIATPQAPGTVGAVASAARPVVLYVIDGHRIGGMETHLLHLVAGLDRTRFTPVICSLLASPRYAARIATLDADHYDMRARKLTSPVDAIRMTRLFRILARHRPRIIHSYGFTCDVIGPFLAKLLPRTRVITTRRGEDGEVGHQRWRSRMNRFTDLIVCVSQATADFTRATENLHRAGIRVIPNGVVIAEVPRHASDTGSASDRPLRFGTLGTVKPIKGTDLLVDAFLRLDPSDACELHIGGRTDVGTWGSELVQRTRAAAGGDRIHFHGIQTDAEEFLRRIDVFVLPSRSEGMSNALLEAMACGLPCLVTDVGSNAAVLAPAGAARPGGLVTTPDVDGLHRALRQALDDPRARSEWAAGAYELACRNHSMKGMVTAHEQIYDELLGR